MHSKESSPEIMSAARRWWSDLAAREGSFAATRALLQALWEFARDSTPSRLKQRYGDADYDWDHRVNTTSAAVGWRDRLLGVFHSPYQPTDPALFHEMLNALKAAAALDFREFTFLDLGSGKGRTLLMASDYPFRRILGVELLAALDAIARENIRGYQRESQRCFALESVRADATTFQLPDGPLIVYLFNPFPEPGLRRLVANVGRSVRASPRPLYVLYHNPVLEHVLSESVWLEKTGSTHQYSIFAARREAVE